MHEEKNLIASIYPLYVVSLAAQAVPNELLQRSTTKNYTPQ